MDFEDKIVRFEWLLENLYDMRPHRNLLLKKKFIKI